MCLQSCYRLINWPQMVTTSRKSTYCQGVRPSVCLFASVCRTVEGLYSLEASGVNTILLHLPSPYLPDLPLLSSTKA